jgi:putative phage-type endonuclease
MPLTTNDLPILSNMVEDVKYIDEHEDADKSDFIETIHIIITDILDNDPRMYEKYDFDERLFDSVTEVFGLCYLGEEEIFKKFNMYDIVHEAIKLYFCINKPRSYKTTFNPLDADYISLEREINKNMKKKQPEQQTGDWYSYRHSMLTASSIWKALAGPGVQNNLIYQKCLPHDKNARRGINVDSAMHWGHKYEPVSTLLYEAEYGTVISEVGCVKHDTIPFLGASPDGINTKRDHPLYGRALEIKNPVSRLLTGTPKFDYWVQMQLQMEVWNFEEVDFLETVFKEYDCEEDFEKDGLYNTTALGTPKGIMVVFSGPKPIYEYMPFNLSKEEGEDWIDKIIDDHSPQHTWIQNTYWYLQDTSCVLVPRNREWFASALPAFANVWKIIERERVTGYMHRAPKKKAKRPIIVTKSIQTQTVGNSSDTTNVATIEAVSAGAANIILSNETILDKKNITVLRIRTESFDQLNQS